MAVQRPRNDVVGNKAMRISETGIRTERIGERMTYEDYYKLFRTFFKGKDYTEIFEEGRKIRVALYDAEHQAAADAWYGNDEGDD